MMTAETAVESRLPNRSRTIGAVAIATGIASLSLLANHPGGQPHDFADLLKQEAANQLTDALVHGGFIAVLAIQLVCYCVFSQRLGLQRTAAVAGLVFFAVGAAFLGGSMLVDGLVIPAIAAKYAAASAAKLEYAKSLFVLCGAALQYLMPIGLLFQAAGVFSWGTALLSSPSRVTGMVALLIGGLSTAGLAMSFASMDARVLMGVIVAMAVWAGAAGLLMLRRKI